MTRWIGITQYGEAVRDTVTDKKPEQKGVVFMEVAFSDPVNTVTQYWNGSVFVDKGDRPTLHHSFDYVKQCWVPSVSAAWEFVKQTRSRLLASSDWTVTKAIETGQAVDSVWASYRQALRDITLQGDPWNIVWPETPV